MIPTKVNIIDTIVTVEVSQIAQAIGFADYHNDKIIIDPTVSDSKKEEIFYHELTHWILYKMGHELEADEHFVGMFGSLLNQAIKNGEEFEFVAEAFQTKFPNCSLCKWRGSSSLTVFGTPHCEAQGLKAVNEVWNNDACQNLHEPREEE